MDEEKLNAVMQQLADQMREYNDNLSRFARSTGGTDKAAFFSKTEVDELSRSMANLKNLTISELEALKGEKKHRGELTHAIKEQIDAEIKRKQITEALTTAVKSATGGLYNFSKSLNDISGDVSKLGDSLTGFGSGLVVLSKNFGNKMQAAALGVQAFTTVLSVALNQTNKMLGAFDEVGKVGGISKITTKELMQLGAASGYSVANLMKYSQVISSMGEDLTALGNSAGAGVKVFTRMTQVGNSTYEAYNRLGISQEEVTKAQAMFVRQAVLGNQSLRKGPEELKKASLEYLDTLIKLRDITGLSFDKQNALLEQAKAQENFNQALANMQYQALEIEKKLKGDISAEERKQLEADLALNKKTREERQKLATLGQYIGGDRGLAYIQLASQKNLVMTEQIAKAMVSGLDPVGIHEKLKTGQDAMFYSMENLAKRGEYSSKTFGDLISDLGESGKSFRDIVGISVKEQEMAMKLVGLTSEEGRKKFYEEMAQDNVSRERRLKEGKLEDGRIDVAKETQNVLLTMNRTLSTALDKAVESLNPFTKETLGAATASLALAAAASAAAGGLAVFGSKKLLDGLKGILGGAVGASGAAGAATVAAGGSMLGRASGLAKGLLGKVALPVLAGTTLYDAAKGFGADSSAGFGSKLLNAGSSALSGLSFGMLGSSAEEIKKRAEAGAGKLGDVATTTSESGQKAVNVNIVGSVPINVNIEKVLDPLFRMAQTPRGQSDAPIALRPGIPIPGSGSGQFGNAPAGTIASPAISSQMTTVLSGAANVSSYTESDLRQMGLNLKKGDVQREGAGIDARLIELAKTLQNMVPGITFTGFADQYHAEKAPNSEHNRGRAFDFVLPPKLAQDDDYRSQLVKELNSMGAFVIDEYSYPSAKSTGGHIHVAITTGNKSQAKPMARGGMILGPGSSTSDSVPAFNSDTGQPIALSTGEYVLPASVTSMLGRGYLDSLISSPNTLKRQGGGSIPGEDGQRVISAAVDLGEGMREIIYSDGSRELSGGFGTRFFDASGKLVKTRTPNFAGLSKDIYADGTEDTHYSAGPMSFSQYASGRRSASINLGMAKISSDTEKGNMIDIFNEDRTERLTSIDQINTLLEQYKNDDSEMKTVLESVKEIFQQMMDKNESLFTEMNSTLKDVVGELEESNSTQEDILNYSRI